MFLQCLFDARDFRPRKPVVLAKTDGPGRAIQIKHGLTRISGHVHVRRPMIVEIDSHAQAAKSQDRWHDLYYHNPKRLGYGSVAACPEFHSPPGISLSLRRLVSGAILVPASGAMQFKVEMPLIPA